MKILAAIFVVILCASCTTIKPYEKEYLLNPLMEDGTAADLTPAMTGVGMATHEKFATGGGSGAGSSCPTCGG